MMRAWLGLTVACFLVLAMPGSTSWAGEGRWSVVPERSAITLRLRAFGTAQTGTFEAWTGDIRFDPDVPEAAEVSIAVQTTSLKMQRSAITSRATGPAFLDAARHPTIRFRLRDLQRTGPDLFQARADVTVKGVTRPVTFPVGLRVEGDTAQMTGGFSLDRAAFDIGTRGPWNRLIDRQVRVNVSLATRRGG